MFSWQQALRLLSGEEWFLGGRYRRWQVGVLGDKIRHASTPGVSEVVQHSLACRLTLRSHPAESSAGLYTVKQSSNHEVLYQVHQSQGVQSEPFDHRAALADFLRLDDDTNLTSLLKQWSESDPVFRGRTTMCKGVRVLRVPALEALLSFICSANNNISRITHMVHLLCSNFGQHIAAVDGQSYHTFPTLELLHCAECEGKLRSLGFGYRAKYIDRCVSQILDRGGEKWLNSLQDLQYEEARKLLRELSGVGPKVADCVCLMGLGHLRAVPVDTHMVRVTARDYGLRVPHSLTDRSYSLVSQHYQGLFGDKAGWAQAVFFASEIQELKTHKHKRKAAPTEPSSGKKKTKRRQ